MDNFFALFFFHLNLPLSYTIDKFRSASPCLKLQTITLIVSNNKMKNLFLILTLVVILTSCNEYTSKFPISTAETSSSYQKLLGEWKFVSHSQDTSNSWDNKLGPHILQVTKFNKNEFLLECVSTLDSTLIIKEYMKKTHLGRGWVSKIKN